MATAKTDYDILNFKPSFWKELMLALALRIKGDAKKGIMQNNTQGNRYRSRQYVDYKSRFMQGKRLTRKVKPYNAKSVISNQTSFVDMHLTGDMFDGLLSSPQADADGFGGTIGYAPQDAGKVLGNQARGYDVLGVSTKNGDWVMNEILETIDENIRKDFAKDITINVG